LSEKRVAAIVLAAGRSSRLGTPKQLLEIGSQTLLRCTVETILAARVGLVVVSLEKGVSAFVDTLHGLDWKRAEVENPQLGQSESIRAGLEIVAQQDFDGVLLTPCDLPLLSSQHLNALITKYQIENSQIVASRYHNVLGAPMLIDRALWPDLRELRGDIGARKILPLYEHTTTFIDWNEGQFDLDTIEDVEKFRRAFSDITSS
jgi:molybdenum cofactor cytidylyltransferase